jgi:hypothetical protein
VLGLFRASVDTGFVAAIASSEKVDISACSILTAEAILYKEINCGLLEEIIFLWSTNHFPNLLFPLKKIFVILIHFMSIFAINVFNFKVEVKLEKETHGADHQNAHGRTANGAKKVWIKQSVNRFGRKPERIMYLPS